MDPIEVCGISLGSTLCTETQLGNDLSVGRTISSDKKRKLNFRSNLWTEAQQKKSK